MQLTEVCPPREGRAKPFVSVVIPARNEERFIRSCLESLRDVGYERDRFEIIVVDNGSTDRTAEIAERCGARVLIFPEGQTIAAVRNHGASRASGEILAFLDADCVVTVSWIDRAVRWFGGEACGVGSRPVSPEDDRTWVQHYWSIILPRSVDKPVMVSWLSSSNMFVRRSTFDKIGGFAENLRTSEDYDLGKRLSEIAPLIYDPQVRAHHLREPRTLVDLLKSEMWHGTSFFKESIIRRRFADKLFLVSVGYAMAIAVWPLALVTGPGWLSLLSSSYLLGIPLVMTARNASRVATALGLARCYVINTVFLLGRAAALAAALRGMRSWERP